MGVYFQSPEGQKGNSGLQQARDRRAMDQGRQAGGALNAIVLSPVPSERGPVAVARARLQPRESLAAARAPETDRRVVAAQSPVAPRQAWRAVSETRALLLPAPGGASPDSAPVRGDAAADLGPAGADRLTCGGRYGARVAKSGRHTGEVSEKCPRTRSLPARATAM